MLERRTPLRAKPRSKGNRAEAEIVQILREHGWQHARRNFGSGSQGGSDIVNGPSDVALEIKRCERTQIWDWLAQVQAAARPTEVPVVVFRRNHSDWHACVPLDEYLALLRLREFGT